MRPMSLGTGWGGQVCCEGVRGRDPGRTRTGWWQGATRPLVVPSTKTSPGAAQWGLHPRALRQHLCAGLASLKGNWERKPGEGKRCVPLPPQPPTQMAGPLFAQPLLGKPRRLSGPSRGSGPGHRTSIRPGIKSNDHTVSYFPPFPMMSTRLRLKKKGAHLNLHSHWNEMTHADSQPPLPLPTFSSYL